MQTQAWFENIADILSHAQSSIVIAVAWLLELALQN